MKIRNTTDSTKSQEVTKALLESQKEKNTRASQGAAQEKTDSVKLALGRDISEALESLKGNSDRAARVAEIKQMLQKGGIAEYFKNVSLDDVAEKTGEEISLEILTSKDALGE